MATVNSYDEVPDQERIRLLGPVLRWFRSCICLKRSIQPFSKQLGQHTSSYFPWLLRREEQVL